MVVNKKRKKKDVLEDFLVALSREQTSILWLELGQQTMPKNPKKTSDPLPALVTEPCRQHRKINKTQPQNLLCYFSGEDRGTEVQAISPQLQEAGDGRRNKHWSPDFKGKCPNHKIILLALPQPVSSRRTKLLEKRRRERREENRRFIRNISGPSGSKYCLHGSPITALQSWYNDMKFSAQNSQLSESSSKADTDLLLRQEKAPYCLMLFIQGLGMLKRLNNSHTAFPQEFTSSPNHKCQVQSHALLIDFER